jgi:hypothetical protein
MSSFKEEDTLYKAIIRRDSSAASAFLVQGESVPEFLYLQASNQPRPPCCSTVYVKY